MRRDGFIECRHPDLPPEQTALFRVPRNGWVPVEEPETSSLETPEGTDSPSAGESTTKDSERNLS